MDSTLTVLTSVRDYEVCAKKLLSPMALDNLSSGRGEEQTRDDNEEAFKRLRLRPRYLHQDTSNVDVSTSLLGSRVGTPIGVAPSAHHKLFWTDEELSSSKGAATSQSCFIQSMGSSCNIAEVSQASRVATRWLHMYMFKKKLRHINLSLIRQAEQHGYSAIVVTIDTAIWTPGRSQAKNPLKLSKTVDHAIFNKQQLEEITDSAGVRDFFDAGATWGVVDWLCSVTRLPIVVKGVLEADDARLAVEHGAKAVFVSNHGGRALDCSLATLDVLPQIVQAVDGRAEVYVDGGVRSGADVLKALALGAKAVFIGRPVLWGLACRGADGVEQVLQILRDELTTAMALTGCRTLEDVSTSILERNPYFSRL